jgi:hypothetical protein
LVVKGFSPSAVRQVRVNRVRAFRQRGVVGSGSGSDSGSGSSVSRSIYSLASSLSAAAVSETNGDSSAPSSSKSRTTTTTTTTTRTAAGPRTSLPPVPENAHRIVLMRHGESEFNNANIFTGTYLRQLLPTYLPNELYQYYN